MISILRSLQGIDILAAGIALIVVLIFSFSLHEFGHAFMAYKQGDYTPKAMGRLTINPLKHMDPIGFLSVILFGFGWAKPVEVNPLRFRKYKTGTVLVSLAGVTINLILAFIGYAFFLLCIKYLGNQVNFFVTLLVYTTWFMYSINISLFVFNLLPIYPLDGFRIVEALTKYGNKFVEFMRKYGTYVLLAFVFIGGFFFQHIISFVGAPIRLFWGWVIGV